MAEQVIVNFTGKNDITPEAKKAESAIKDVGTTAEAQGSKFSGMKEIARGAFQAIGSGALGLASSIGSGIVGGVSDFFTSAVQGSIDYQNVLAQTEAVVESTGGAAGFTVQQMEEMARSMSSAAGMSLFSDDTILGAQNVLATFTKIEGVQFEGATQAALDMAQALGMDASSAAMMMGKALNDPVKGLSALSRSGVSFTAEQQAMVEAMVEAGDVAGAQNLILGEMATQFGGSALKATETFEGSMILLSEGIEDAKGSIGDALLPILTRFANVAMAQIVPAIADITAKFGAWFTALDWDAIITSISGVVSGMMSFVSGIPWDSIFTAFNTFGAFFISQLPLIMSIVQPVIDAIVNIVKGLIAIFTGPEMQSIAGNVMTVVGVVAGVFGTLIAAIEPVIQRIITAVQGLMPPIQTAFQMITDTISSPTVTQAFNGIAEVLGIVGEIVVQVAEIYLQKLIARFNELWPTVDTVIQAIGTVINAVIPVVKGVLESLMMYLDGDATGALNKLKETFSTVWNNIKASVMGIVEDIKKRLGEFMTEVLNTATALGTDIMSGVAKGISSGAQKIKDAMKNAVGDAIQFAKDILGIASPSKVMAKVVGQPIGQGIAAGIVQSAGDISAAMGYSVGAATGATQQTVQNYYLSASYTNQQSESSIMADLRAMQLLSGAV